MSTPAPTQLSSALCEELRSAVARAEGGIAGISVAVAGGASRALLDLDATTESTYFVAGTTQGTAQLGLQDRATYVGLGAVASRRFEGATRFQDAQAFVLCTFARVRLPEELRRVVRFFGGASFSPGRDGSGRCWSEFGDARFFLPRCLYVDDENEPGAPARLVCLASQADVEETLALARRILDVVGRGPHSLASPAARPRTLGRLESERPDSWQQLIEGIKDEIGHGHMEKVVAARRVTLELSEAPRASTLVERMNEQSPSCARFAFRVGEKTFIGATPERLVSLDGMAVTTEALAGSIAATEVNAETRLIENQKDRAEHAFVVQAIQSVLEPKCREFFAPEAPEVRRLSSIYHLRTPIHGKLRNPTHVLELVSELHPTPAVGGLPREAAVRFISEREQAERGWYAAPFGWIDCEGNGLFVVALRSGLLAKNKVHLYAGAGIVSDSNSDAEYEETELKLSGMLGALGLAPAPDPSKAPHGRPTI